MDCHQGCAQTCDCGSSFRYYWFQNLDYWECELEKILQLSTSIIALTLSRRYWPAPFISFDQHSHDLRNTLFSAKMTRSTQTIHHSPSVSSLWCGGRPSGIRSHTYSTETADCPSDSIAINWDYVHVPRTSTLYFPMAATWDAPENVPGTYCASTTSKLR